MRTSDGIGTSFCLRNLQVAEPAFGGMNMRNQRWTLPALSGAMVLAGVLSAAAQPADQPQRGPGGHGGPGFAHYLGLTADQQERVRQLQMRQLREDGDKAIRALLTREQVKFDALQALRHERGPMGPMGPMGGGPFAPPPGVEP